MIQLEIKNISKSFGGNHVLNNVSLKLVGGLIYTVMGDNGAGKTTLLNIINGHVNQHSGDIKFGSQDLLQKKVHDRAKSGVLRLWQEGRIFRQMTVLENLTVSVNSLGENPLNYIFSLGQIRNENKTIAQKADAVLEQIGLENYGKQLAGELSFGQQRLLALGRIMMRTDELEKGECIVLVDEPFSGIHQDLIKVIQTQLREFAQMGNLILLVEHNLKSVLEFTDSLIVLGADQEVNVIDKSTLNRLSETEIYNMY